MFGWLKISMAAATIALLASPAEARKHARWGNFPLIQCGPELNELCPIKGFFDDAPFRYHLAIYPGCIRTIRHRTPSGIRYERVLICG